MTLESIEEKIIPSLIIAIIFAVFGLFMRVSYLEYTAESSLQRYAKDMEKIWKD